MGSNQYAVISRLYATVWSSLTAYSLKWYNHLSWCYNDKMKIWNFWETTKWTQRSFQFHFFNHIWSQHYTVIKSQEVHTDLDDSNLIVSDVVKHSGFLLMGLFSFPCYDLIDILSHILFKVLPCFLVFVFFILVIKLLTCFWLLCSLCFPLRFWFSAQPVCCSHSLLPFIYSPAFFALSAHPPVTDTLPVHLPSCCCSLCSRSLLNFISLLNKTCFYFLTSAVLF